MMVSGPLDSKTSHFVSLNFLTSKLNFTLDRGFQRESMLWAPWQRTWVWGPRLQRERKTRAAAGQTEPALFPCSTQRCSPGRCLSERSQRAWRRLHALFTQVSSLPREAQALQTCVDHMLPGDGCSHLQAAKGEKLRPTVGQGGFLG